MSAMFNSSNEYFVKGALTFSLMTMLLMTSFIAVFVPDPDQPMGYENEMDELLSQYNNLTGRTTQNEQIWGLTGIYTPYGIDKDGKDSTAHLTLSDGWVAGARIESYTPSQFSTDSGFAGGNESYTVTYDKDRGLYYYTKHGSNLLDITDGNVSDPAGNDADNNPKGTLYTSVAMDKTKQSQQFFTVGTKTQLDNGTFYYNYTGYRYCYQPLSDYYYSESTPITHTDTSLSLIWYQYTVDSGISGQLVLSGSDSGVSYITATQIVNSFNSANYTSKFTMQFNGIDMFIYVHLNVYAINHGYSVEDCYNNGFWDVLVTSPSTSNEDEAAGGTFNNFDANRVFEVVVGLLSFNGEDYGLTGVAGTVASTVFSLSLYTSLIAIGLSFWPVLLIAGLLATIQTLSITDLWPF